MSARARVTNSAYMNWARLRSQARFNLAASGVMNYPRAELDVQLADIELHRPSLYGYEPLQQAIAAKCEVTPDCVVAATGTSGANHLVMSLLLEPGDEVLIESPTYELLVATAEHIGAVVKRFNRAFASNYLIDPAEITRLVSPRTRLIVLTNLHNPSSTLTHEDVLKTIGEIARAADAHVLVDEVYLDAMFERAPRSAFHLGAEFIVTNSLTKVYGLSGLRCGWILAAPTLAERLWRLNDLFGVNAAHPAERLSCVALAQLPRIATRARVLLEVNGATFNTFLAGRHDLACAPHEYGTVAFPRWRGGDVTRLCALLREKYETTVVPGHFFDAPEHFRIGLGGETDALIEGLTRLGAALEEVGAQ
ncbi:MAG: aminotransferase class I/II-fold pyridoxal phosphate-dependent enzyme [Pyrinomonadaceae bacterium]